MISWQRQRGYLLITVIVTLFLLAAVAVLLTQDSAISANTASSELESAQADYVARAGMQHALWQTTNSACSADVNIPATSLGKHSYSATATSAASTNVFIVGAGKDTHLDPAQPKTNFGSEQTAAVKNNPPNSIVALYHFDLSSVTKGTRIASATAWFYVDDNDPLAATEVRSMDTAWTETAATWENAGAGIGSTVYGLLPPQESTGVWVNVNLTALAQAWANEPTTNHGIVLSGTSDKETAKYTTREYSKSNQRPFLQVTTADAAVSPVVIKATGTLTNGVERTLTQPYAVAYQPPNVATLQLGTDPGADTLVDSFYERNYGGSDYLQINNESGWTQRPLLRFDLGAVPPGAKVISAQLELRKWSVNAAGTATVHRLTRNFVEGTRNGGGTADGATWATYDGSSSWTTAGGDFDAAVVAETYIDTSGEWVSWDIGPLVDAWANGEPNYGLLIEGSSGLKQAKFASRGNSDVTVHPKLTITYACECDTPCLSQSGQGNILMVVRDATNMWYYDIQKKAILESWGYTVNIIDDDASTAEYDAGIAANDVAYISEPVRESSLNTKLSDAPIGVVSDEGRMNDELGMAQSFATPVLGTAINVSDTSHYITQVFPAGPLDIYTHAMEGLTVAGTEAPELQTLADWGGAGSLVALESGATTVSGGSSPGRRVMLPFGRQVDSNVNWDRLNSNGRLIAQRAIAWAMGVKKAAVGKNVLLVVGDTANLTVEQADKKELMEGWGHTVSLIATSASQAEFDLAADAVDAVYIPELGTTPMTELGGKADNLPKGVITEEARRVIKLGGFVLLPFVDTTSINILDNSHYLTEALPTGNVVLSTATQSFWKLGGTLAPDLHILGELTGSVPGLAYVDVGETVNDGSPAAGRRVKLPWGSYNFDVNLLTDDALDIMQRAIMWGAGPELSGPIAHWRLDETSGTTAVDSVGGNDGTLQYGPAWTTGQVDGGLDFDGSDDAVSAGAPATLQDMFDGGGTLTAWMHPDGWGEGNYGRIVDKSSPTYPSAGWALELYGANSSFLLQVGFSGATGSWITPNGSVSLSAWQHVALVYDNSSDANDPVIFIDGAQQTITELDTPSGSLSSDTGINFTIGNHAMSTVRTFNGQLDDVRVYDRMLSAAEIAELATPPSTAPIAHWRLDDAAGLIAVDSVGGHDGTLLNMTESNWGTGQIDGGLDFPGNNDYINVPHDDALSLTDLTISLWLKTPTLNTVYQTMVRKKQQANYQLSTWDDEIVFAFNDGSGMKLFQTTNANLTTNTWHHVAATLDDTTGDIDIYVDGNPIYATTTPYHPLPNTEPLTLGGVPDSSTYWPGMLDDIRLYDRALTAAEVADLYTAGSGGGGGGGGGSCDGNFRDNFDTRVFNGSNGSLTWTTDWIEVGESSGPTSGDIQVMSNLSNNRLRTRDNDNGGEGAEREADLSGAATATLNYDYRRMNLDSSSDYTSVEISANGAAGPWDELTRHSGSGNDSSYQPASHQITAYISVNTRIRFKTSSSMGNTDTVWFDNVEIVCSP